MPQIEKKPMVGKHAAVPIEEAVYYGGWVDTRWERWECFPSYVTLNEGGIWQSICIGGSFAAYFPNLFRQHEIKKVAKHLGWHSVCFGVPLDGARWDEINGWTDIPPFIYYGRWAGAIGR